MENVNTTVKDFLAVTNQDIKHLIAQKDIPFSNSEREVFNKIIKHQFKTKIKQKDLITSLTQVSFFTFLYPKNIEFP